MSWQDIADEFNTHDDLHIVCTKMAKEIARLRATVDANAGLGLEWKEYAEKLRETVSVLFEGEKINAYAYKALTRAKKPGEK